MAITDNPQIGDSVSFGLTKSDVTWTAPIEGFYNIYCYVAKGGSGWGAAGVNGQGGGGSGGTGGSLRASTAFIAEGTVLNIRVGGQGENGAIGEENKRNAYGGWNGGASGNTEETWCDNEGWDHSGKAVSGGGGGGSYIQCNGVRIISAAGGKGGDASYVAHDGSGSAQGGAGGGTTTLSNASGVQWLALTADIDSSFVTNKIDTTSSGVRNGDGQVTITFAEYAFPKIYFNGEKLKKMKYNGKDVVKVYFNGMKL